MRTYRFKLAGILLAAVVSLSIGKSLAEETAMPPMPQPTQQHQWLQQFVGEWQSQNQMVMDPSQPPVESAGTEIVRPMGEFWTLTEVNATMMDMPFKGQMTLGYSAEKEKFVGTWVDSMTGQLWEYEGNLNEAGNTLVLEAEGPCPMRGGKMTKFREELILKDKDHKTYRSSIMDDEGNWVTMLTSEGTRQK